MTTSGWYYSLADGESTGPVSFKSLQAAIRCREIKPDDLVWHEAIGEWQRVAHVPELNRTLCGLSGPTHPTPPPIQVASDMCSGNSRDPILFAEENTSATRRSLFGSIQLTKRHAIPAISIVALSAFFLAAMLYVSVMGTSLEDARKDLVETSKNKDGMDALKTVILINWLESGQMPISMADDEFLTPAFSLETQRSYRVYRRAYLDSVSDK